MIIDEKKLRKNLSKKFKDSVLDKIIESLKMEGLPIKMVASSFELEVGHDINIKFINDDNEILLKNNWIAKIQDIDPMQIKSIRIPELKYDECDLMSIDITLYPFKIESVSKFLKNKEE